MTSATKSEKRPEIASCLYFLLETNGGGNSDDALKSRTCQRQLGAPSNLFLLSVT